MPLGAPSACETADDRSFLRWAYELKRDSFGQPERCLWERSYFICDEELVEGLPRGSLVMGGEDKQDAYPTLCGSEAEGVGI